MNNAFRLLPEGLTFAQQPTLKVNFSSADLAGSVADTMQIAFQDSAGYWNMMNVVTRDLSAHTVSVQLPHFSDWSRVTQFQVFPAQATLAPNATLDLRVTYCAEPTEDLGSLAGKYDCLPADDVIGIPYPRGAAQPWKVNSKVGGDANSIGTIVAHSKSDWDVATYTAPPSVPNAPTPNPEAVSIDYKASSTEDFVLVSNITIAGDQYAGSLTIPAGDAAGAYGTQTASITWARANPDPLAAEGGATYYGTGTWQTLATYPSCDEQLVVLNLDVRPSGVPSSYLEVYSKSSSSPYAGKYRFAILTETQVVTPQCGGTTKVPTPTPVSQSIYVGICATMNAPLWTDITQLLQSTPFTVATNGTDACNAKEQATWDFTAPTP